MSTATLEPPHPATEIAPRRLNVNLTEEAYSELEKLARSAGRSKTDLVRFALGLLRYVLNEKGQNRRFAVLSNDGQILKEFVVPL